MISTDVEIIAIGREVGPTLSKNILTLCMYHEKMKK
jgi:hypothetical protein